MTAVERVYHISELETKYSNMLDRFEDIIECFQNETNTVKKENILLSKKIDEIINYLRAKEEDYG